MVKDGHTHRALMDPTAQSEWAPPPAARVGVKLNAPTPANKHAKSCCELKHQFIKRREKTMQSEAH